MTVCLPLLLVPNATSITALITFTNPGIWNTDFIYRCIIHYLGFTPPCGVTTVTEQCGCDNVTNMYGPSSDTPQGITDNSLGFAAKVLDQWTNARPMKCRRTRVREELAYTLRCRALSPGPIGTARDQHAPQSPSAFMRRNSDNASHPVSKNSGVRYWKVWTIWHNWVLLRKVARSIGYAWGRSSFS